MHRNRNPLRRFLSDEGGSVIVFIGFAILMLVVAGGVAIDIARGQAVQSKLHAALDAAGLGAGKAATNDIANGIDPTSAQFQTDITNAANAYFMANFPSGYLGTTPYNGTPPIAATYQSSTGTIVMTVNANGITQSTSIMQIAGISSVNVSDTSTIKVLNATQGQCGITPGACIGASPTNDSGLGTNPRTWTCPGSGSGSSASCIYYPPACSNPLEPGICASTSILGPGYQEGSGQWQCLGTATQTVGSSTIAIANFSTGQVTCGLTNGQCNFQAIGTPECTVGANGPQSVTSHQSPAGSTWTCASPNGGTPMNCAFIDGVCGPSSSYMSCQSGTAVVVNAATQDWICSGSAANGTVVINGITYNTTPGFPSNNPSNTYQNPTQGAGKDCLGNATPICGSLASADGASTANACDSNSVLISGPTAPDRDGNYSWVCGLTNDPAATMTCTAYNGVCNSTAAPSEQPGGGYTGACLSTPGSAQATLGNGVWNWQCNGSGNGGTSAPCTFTVGSGGGGSVCPDTCVGKPLVYIADSGNNRVAVYATDGTYCKQFGVGTLNNPQQLALDATGQNVYVLDVNPSNANDTRISKFPITAVHNTAVTDDTPIFQTSIGTVSTGPGNGCYFGLNKNNGGITANYYGIFIAINGTPEPIGTSNDCADTGILELADNGSSVSRVALYGDGAGPNSNGAGCFGHGWCNGLDGASKLTLQGSNATVIQLGGHTDGYGDEASLPGASNINLQINGNGNDLAAGESYSAYSADVPFSPVSIAQDPKTNNWWIVSNDPTDANDANLTFTWILRIVAGDGFNKYDSGASKYNQYNGDHYVGNPPDPTGPNGYEPGGPMYSGIAAYGAAFDASSNLYLTDYTNNKVLVLSDVDANYTGNNNLQPVSSVFGTTKGTSCAGSSALNGPIGIAVQQKIPIFPSCNKCPQDPTTGIECEAGTCRTGFNPSTATPDYTTSGSTVSWQCQGFYNGGTITCSNEVPVPGECPSASALAYPVTNPTCGTDPGYSGIQPQASDIDKNTCGNIDSWICHGNYGGDAYCEVTGLPKCIPPLPPNPCGSNSASSSAIRPDFSLPCSQ